MVYVEAVFESCFIVRYWLPNVYRLRVDRPVSEIRFTDAGYAEVCLQGPVGAVRDVDEPICDERRTVELTLAFGCVLRIRTAPGLKLTWLRRAPVWTELRFSESTAWRSPLRFEYFTLYGGRVIPYKETREDRTAFTRRGRRIQRRCYKTLAGIGPHKCERCSLYCYAAGNKKSR